MSFRNTPALPNGYSTAEWVNGETRFVKDNGASGSGEIFAFMWADSTSNLCLVASSDNGQSWHYVTSHASTAYRVQAMTQDNAGRVHAVAGSTGTDSGTYLRIALSYTNKLISDFSIATTIALPNHGRTGDELRADIKIVKNNVGTDTLMYEVNMATIAIRPVVDIKAYMAYATSLTPATAADFRKMDGSGSGDSLVFDNCTYSAGSFCAGGNAVGTFSNHIHTALFAQDMQTKDVYLFQGPIDADWGISYGGAADWITYTRMTATSGNAWTVPSPATGTGTVTTHVGTSPGLSYAPQLFSVFSGSNHAWIMFNDPVTGIRFGSYGSGGYSELGSPVTTTNRNGWGVFTVSADETKIWSIWYTLSSTCLNSGNLFSCGSPLIQEAYYSSATGWNTYNDLIVNDIYSIVANYSTGMAGISGWTTGTAALILNGHGVANAPEQPVAATIWSN